MTNHFARGSRGFSTSAATSGAAASGAGAGSGSGSSANISLIFCSTVGSSVMTPSWSGLAAQHLREEPGKQRIPRAQVRRQDRQDGHDDDGGRHQLSPARPVHPLEFGPDLAGIAHQPVPDRGAFGPRDRGTGGDPRGLLIDAGFRETGHGASHKKKDFTATAHYRGGILACQSDDLWSDPALRLAALAQAIRLARVLAEGHERAHHRWASRMAGAELFLRPIVRVSVRVRVAA